MADQRRPRIPADLAAKIDADRGAGEPFEIPFERYVRDRLEQFFRDRERNENATLADQLYDLMIELDSPFDQLDQAVEEVKARHRKELDDYAVEEEHTDEEGNMDDVAFDRAYPTDGEKRDYFRQLRAQGDPNVDELEREWFPAKGKEG